MQDESEKNYKLINIRLNRDSNHLYCLEDKCLYKKNGKQKDQYYICIGKNEIEDSQCQASGKLKNGKFIRLKTGIKKHNHEDHSHQAEVEEIKLKIKQDVKELSTPISEIFRNCTKKYSIKNL